MAWRHRSSVYKMGNRISEQKESRIKLPIQRGWRTYDNNIHKQ